MPVGYLPDMFGHCAQMPQLLRHVGIEHAVVCRGVPAAVDCHEFWWRSPDGTGIRTEFLVNSYGNAADVFGSGAAAERLAARLADAVEGVCRGLPRDVRHRPRRPASAR